MSEQIPHIPPQQVDRLHRQEIFSLKTELSEVMAPMPDKTKRTYLGARRTFMQMSRRLTHDAPYKVSDIAKQRNRVAFETAASIQKNYPDVFSEAAGLLDRIDAIDRQHGWQSY